MKKRQTRTFKRSENSTANTNLSYNQVMNTIIEIRAAEGGDDAKQLVLEQARIYEKLCSRNGL